MEMQFVAWFAAALVFSSFFMKTIVPLRTLAIASNVVFSEKVLELFYQDKRFAFQIARALSHYVAENTELVADSRLMAVDSLY